MMKLQEIIASTLGYEHYDMCFEETEFLLEDLDLELTEINTDESDDNEIIDENDEELDLDDFLGGIK